jgi:hypothetical protein
LRNLIEEKGVGGEGVRLIPGVEAASLFSSPENHDGRWDLDIDGCFACRIS